MRGPVVFSLLFIVPLLGGCQLSRQIVHDTRFEGELFHSVEKRRHEIKHEAKDVLKEVCSRHPHRELTRDFREGFVDGYFDYMEYGGPVRPHAQPPAKYRTAKFLTPEGQCQIRDYNLGFQYGAECAESTGHRQYYTVPVLVTPTFATPPLNITTLPRLPDATDADKSPVPETAPVPKADASRPMTPAVPMSSPMTTPMPMPPSDVPKVIPKPMTPLPAPPVTTTPPMATPPMGTTPAPMTIPGSSPLPVPRTSPLPEVSPSLPPKADLPKVDPPKTDPKPSGTTSNVPLLPPLPIPIPLAPSAPPPIPLIPTLPTVTLTMPPSSGVTTAGYIAQP